MRVYLYILDIQVKMYRYQEESPYMYRGANDSRTSALSHPVINGETGFAQPRHYSNTSRVDYGNDQSQSPPEMPSWMAGWPTPQNLLQDQTLNPDRAEGNSSQQWNRTASPITYNRNEVSVFGHSIHCY